MPGILPPGSRNVSAPAGGRSLVEFYLKKIGKLCQEDAFFRHSKSDYTVPRYRMNWIVLSSCAPLPAASISCSLQFSICLQSKRKQTNKLQDGFYFIKLKKPSEVLFHTWESEEPFWTTTGLYNWLSFFLFLSVFFLLLWRKSLFYRWVTSPFYWWSVEF